MKKRPTLKEVENMIANSKNIESFTILSGTGSCCEIPFDNRSRVSEWPPQPMPDPYKEVVKPSRSRKTSKASSDFAFKLKEWCKTNKYLLFREHKFHPARKFRFDFYIPALHVGIEYEGLIGEKSRHTTIGGYSRDAEKYNLASIMGITILRYTVLIEDQVLADLQELINNRIC